MILVAQSAPPLPVMITTYHLKHLQIAKNFRPDGEIEATSDLFSLTDLTVFNQLNQVWQLNQLDHGRRSLSRV